MRPAADRAPNPWDEHASAYAAWVARRYPADPAAVADEPLWDGTTLRVPSCQTVSHA
jgi:hypothetical protein